MAPIRNKKVSARSEVDAFRQRGMDLMTTFETRLTETINLVQDKMKDGYDSFFFDKLVEARTRIRQGYIFAYETDTREGWKRFYEIANQLGSTTTEAALADVIVFSSDPKAWKRRHQTFLSLYNSKPSRTKMSSMKFILQKMLFKQ